MLTEAKDTKWSENNPELIREFESKLCVLSKQKEKKKNLTVDSWQGQACHGSFGAEYRLHVNGFIG